MKTEKEIWLLYLQYVIDTKFNADLPLPKDLENINIEENKYYIKSSLNQSNTFNRNKNKY